MLALIEQIAPGTIQLMNERLDILKKIEAHQPVGRRILADKLTLTERVLRSEIDILRSQSLITVNRKGMQITDEGNRILCEIGHLLEVRHVTQRDEARMAKHLNIKGCTIVEDLTDSAVQSLARKTAMCIARFVPEGPQTVAVMGGTTMREVAEECQFALNYRDDLTFVPARGGASGSVDIQANTIAARMAELTGGTCRILHAPEHVKEKTHSLLLEEPEIKETLNFLSKAILVIFSIGDANEMARRFRLKEHTTQELERYGAVAEAFGEFINEAGQIVGKVARIGLSANQLAYIPNVLAVAGGVQKAKAVQAYCKIAPDHTWLVTDRAIVNEVLNGGNPLK